MKIYSYKKSGFTLLELMIVIVILGVLCLLSFQGVNQSVRLQKATNGIQQVGYALNKARYYAKSKGETVTVIFSSNSNTYTIETDDHDLTDSRAIDGTSGILPSGIKVIHSDQSQIFFDIDGQPMSSMNPKMPISYVNRLTVGYENGPQKSLLITPVSGRIVYE